MEGFLRERGEHDAFLKMRGEKIDEENIMEMSEDDLKLFLPKYGDRIALRSFLSKRPKRKGDNKMSLLEKLRHKLKRNRTEEDDAGPSTSALELPPGFSSKNALKNKRFIEFGLMVYDASTCDYKPIRSKKGGGVRKVKVSKDSRKNDLLNLAKEIFLGNEFGYGSPEDFHCDIMDYKQLTLEGDITVGQIIDKTKLQKLRFYLALKRKTEMSLDSDDSLPELSIPPRKSAVGKDQDVGEHSPMQQQSNTYEQTVKTSTALNTNRSDLSEASSNVMNLRDLLPLFDRDPEISFGPTDGQSSLDDTIPLQHDLDVLITENSTDHLDTPRHTESVTAILAQDVTLQLQERTINVRRGNCLTDLMEAFSDDSILQQIITIVRTIESGKKEVGAGNGVTIDCLCEFWGDFYERCTIGLEEKVPFLRHDFKDREWQACAGVYLFGWAHFKYIPLQLSVQFIKATLGRPCDNPVDSFLRFLNREDRQVISSALKDFHSIAFDDLLDSLSNHSVKKRVAPETLLTIIEEVAHKELIQEPMFVIDSWKAVLQTSAFGLISDNDLLALYAESKPTGRKVVNRLAINAKEKNEEDVGNYLKKYIREADTTILGSFLRFCTGSDLLLDSNKVITVEFLEMHEVCRNPVGRTCTQTIQLANKFDNFPQFRTEMNNVLRSNIWVFDIV